jgi:hypothetical protein
VRYTALEWWIQHPRQFFDVVIFRVERHLFLYGTIEVLFGTILAVIWWAVDNASASDETAF